MKRKLAALGTAVMAAVAITVCSGKDAKTTIVAEMITQANTTAGVADGEAENVGAASGSKIVAEPQSPEFAPQEVTLLKEAENVSHAGAELEQSKIKPFVEKVQKAVADKDMEVLAGLCVCPAHVSLGEGQSEEIADESAFLEMDVGQIFTKGLLRETADTNVDTLEQFNAGVIMGEENSVIFNNVDGQTAITGINPS